MKAWPMLAATALLVGPGNPAAAQSDQDGRTVYVSEAEQQERSALIDRARGAFDIGDWTEAARIYRQLIARAEQEDDDRIVYLLKDLANVYKAADRCDDAVPLYRRELALSEEQWDEDNDSAFDTRTSLAQCLSQIARYAEAEREYRHLLALVIDRVGEPSSGQHGERWDGTTAWVAFGFLTGLEQVLDAAGRRREIEPLYRDALARYTMRRGENDRCTLAVRHRLILALEANGRSEEAARLRAGQPSPQQCTIEETEAGFPG